VNTVTRKRSVSDGVLQMAAETHRRRKNTMKKGEATEQGKD